MKVFGSIQNKLSNIPEFSDKTYSIVGIFFALTISASGGYLIFEIVTTDALVLKPEWNMFKSPLGNLCLIIGFVCALLFWGKFVHWTQIPLIGHRDSFGNWVWKENMDITEQMLYRVILPLIGHFVIEPIIYAAFIYYPLQVVIALVGAVFPYVVSLIIVGGIVFAWMFTDKVQSRYHSVMVVLYGLVLTGIFSYVGYIIHEPGNNTDGGAGEPVIVNDTVTVETIHKDTVREEKVVTVTEEKNHYYFPESEESDNLLESLLEGTTVYEGLMDTIPVVMNITKNSERQQLYAMFIQGEDLRIRLLGSSSSYGVAVLDFSGMHHGDNWLITLKGSADHLEGTVNREDEDLSIILNKKVEE